MNNSKRGIGLRHPFGEECCEAEVKILKELYSDYYFLEAPFNKDSLDSETYLIIGRRGSGKTSLAQYFTFQKKLRRAKCIDVDEPNIYYEVLSRVSKLAATSTEIAIPRIVQIWEFLVWSLIFGEYKNYSTEIEAASYISPTKKGPAHLVKELLKSIIRKFAGNDVDQLSDELEDYLSSPVIEAAKKRVLELTNRSPIIVAVDSLERYSVNDEAMMRSTAALIQCASNFNIEHAINGIHVKAFISAEVFPHLCEAEISNTSKHVREEIYLHWRPKDLVRLVSWRFHKHLSKHSQLKSESMGEIDWNNFSEVLQKMWIPYFGEEITNGLGLREKTFPYVIRHTQMRPRQIIKLLNKIAKRSHDNLNFPEFCEEAIVDSIRKAEKSLATEVINSYSKAYENVGKIIDALSGVPILFEGRLLDKRASKTASEWTKGHYSPSNFKQLVSELGIVGKVRSWDKRRKIIEADFEYALEDRLPLLDDDLCVIHPMFIEKLRVNTTENQVIVYPFPDHPDFDEVR
ncbi:MAG: hypothetical protein JAY90_19535 [Candidatus Thiodiazotropha lotti]|nr:hypothetical protein [Candidatus Thiodiazotropha lotti]